MHPQEIEARIVESLPGAKVTVCDRDGDRTHYSAEVTWAGFAELSLVERHRAVFGVLEDFLESGKMHALELKCALPLDPTQGASQ